MAQFFADEDFHGGVVEELQRLGHDVETAFSAGIANRGTDDSVGLMIATGQGRTVLTHNRRHFQLLHIRQQPHAGIIVCTRDDKNPAALAQRIIDAVGSRDDLSNQLFRVNKPPLPRKQP